MDKIERPGLINSYIQNMVHLLKAYDPYSSDEKIYEFVRQTVKQRIHIPEADVIVHKEYGGAEHKKVDLLKFLKFHSNKVIVPSGTIYKGIDIQRSFMKQFIDHFLKTRKVLKKEMLAAEEAGDKTLAQLKNYSQSTVKIRINSLIGAAGNQFNCFSDKAGFNSVTSTARHCIMLAYTHTERFIIGNFYFPTIEHVLNHILLLTRICPPREEVMRIVDKYKLFIPFPSDVTDFFMNRLASYINITTQQRTISRIVDNLPAHVLVFMFYYSNLHHICKYNSDTMKQLIRLVFNTDMVDHTEEVDPTDLFKIDEDLLMIITVHSVGLLEGHLLFDTPKDHPEIAKKLIRIGKHMHKHIVPITEIINFFTNTSLTIPCIVDSKNMTREVTILSDTDSVVFTTKNWVEWYTGSINFTSDAFDIDSLVTYFLSKSLEHVLTKMSIDRGALGSDIKAIKMKNEFTYPIMVNCIIPKHYAGIITVQEGKTLPEPKTDIKGVSFRGSSLQANTLDYVKSFLLRMVNDVYDKAHPEKIGSIDISKYITDVVVFEQTIIKSLHDGETIFMNVVPVKAASNYKTPDSSIHFNYLFWMEVFADTYGEIQVPSKCPIVPIDKKVLYSETYLSNLKSMNPSIHSRMLIFLNKHKDKNITRIPLNPVLTSTPAEIIPLIHTRSIAYINSAPLYLAMSSLAMNMGANSNKRMLFSDIYLGEQSIRPELAIQTKDIVSGTTIDESADATYGLSIIKRSSDDDIDTEENSFEVIDNNDDDDDEE